MISTGRNPIHARNEARGRRIFPIGKKPPASPSPPDPVLRLHRRGAVGSRSPPLPHRASPADPHAPRPGLPIICGVVALVCTGGAAVHVCRPCLVAATCSFFLPIDLPKPHSKLDKKSMEENSIKGEWKRIVSKEKRQQ
jgi:hypothetical protein